MKCPHCEYEDWIYTDDGGEFAGAEGRFFELSTVMTQQPLNPKRYYDAHAHLYGCPSCFKTFIDVQ